MLEILTIVAVIVMGIAVTVGRTRSSGAVERTYIPASLAMHYAFAFVLRFSQGGVFGEGDLGLFREGSGPLLGMLRHDFFRWAPEILRMMFRLNSDLGGGDPTASMMCVTAFGRYFLVDSFHLIYCVLASFSFLAKWGIYAAFRDNLRPDDRRPLLLGTMCLPSAVFWTSGLVKETLAVMGLGAIVYGAHRAITKRSLLSAVLIGVGALLVGLFKPYFLFPFVVGATVWLFFGWSKNARGLRPIYLVLGVVLAYGCVMALGALFPQFAPGHFAEQVAEQQLQGERAGGGSYYRIGDATVTSLSGQLAYAPLALLTTLARPALFEVHNVSSGIASLEMTVLTFFLLRAFLRGGRSVFSYVMGRPILMFAFAFTVLAATGVGLAVTNFGTLSRYRVPIMPFYAALVVAAVHCTRSRKSLAAAPAFVRVRSPARSPGPRRGLRSLP